MNNFKLFEALNKLVALIMASASTSTDSAASSSKTAENVSDDLEPGACPESILNPTDSFEEFASEMSSSLQERDKSLAAKNSTISEIQSEIGDGEKALLKNTKSSDEPQTKDVCFYLYFHCDMKNFLLLSSHQI